MKREEVAFREPELSQEEAGKTEKQKYYFEKLEKLEPAMISLVSQLKTAIETGEYEVFLSDDAGGRIPTLVLKYVSDLIREKLEKIYSDKPERIPKKIRTYFLAAGGETPDKRKKNDNKNYNEMIKYLLKMDFKDGKLLVISQFTESCSTFKKIGLALRDERINIKNFDFASLYINALDPASQGGSETLKKEFNAELFLGSQEKRDMPSWISQKHEEISGVEKKYHYSPKVKKKKSISYSLIRKSRMDLKLMAKKIAVQIWPELK